MGTVAYWMGMEGIGPEHRAKGTLLRSDKMERFKRGNLEHGLPGGMSGEGSYS